MSKNCTPLWREAHVEVNMYKTFQPRTTFRSCDVEPVHVIVARSTCGVNMSKLRHVRAIYRRPDVVQMSKKCTPLWREACFQVKVLKTEGFEKKLSVNYLLCADLVRVALGF